MESCPWSRENTASDGCRGDALGRSLEPDDDESEWIMLISELSFPHLQAAHDERLAQELERRRVVQERLDEQGAGRSRDRAVRAAAPSSERMPRATVVASGPGSAEACPA